MIRLPPDIALHVFAEADEITVEVTARGQFVGSLVMMPATTRPDWMRRSCARAVQRLQARAGRRLRAWMVLETEISPEWYGRGLGLALYDRALSEAARRGALLMPNACLYDEDTPGTTSSMAQATWRRLAALPGVLSEVHRGQVVAAWRAA